MSRPAGFTHDAATRRKIADGVRRARAARREDLARVGEHLGYALTFADWLERDPSDSEALMVVRENLADAAELLRGEPDLRAGVLRSLAIVDPVGAKAATATATLYKSAPSSYETSGKGRVEALVSVFNTVDLIGDRVMPGAFKGSIDRWKASGDMPPVIFSHSWSDPWHHLGVVTRMEETAKGLRVEYELDVEENPVAAQVHRLLKQRRVTEHSFAYDVRRDRTADDGAHELLELDLIEVGPTLRGMHPDTELLGVKAAPPGAPERTAYDRLTFDPQTREPQRQSFLGKRAREAASTVSRASGSAAASPAAESSGGGAAFSGPAVIGGVLRCQADGCSAMIQRHGHPSDRPVLCAEHAEWTPPLRGGHLDPRTGGWRPDPDVAAIDEQMERLDEQRQRLVARKRELQS